MGGYNTGFMGRAELEAIGVTCSGNDVQVHSSVVIVSPDRLRLGNHVRVDPFTLLSATGGISLGNHIHIGSHCTLIGGGGIQVDDFAGISHGTRLFSASDDFSGSALTGPTLPAEFRKVTQVPIHVGRHAVIASGAVILPGVTLEEGAIVGALSLVRSNIPGWQIWAGQPARYLADRDRGLLGMESEVQRRDQSTDNS